MQKFFQKYQWKEAVPMGSIPIAKEMAQRLERSFQILSDPYRKRFSIEQYSFGIFKKVVYDSALFDFRQLRQVEQAAWSKEKLLEEETKVECLIRDENHRVILKEIYRFQNGTCIHCDILSIHGISLAEQNFYFQHKGDAFNGVALFDSIGSPVMFKRYKVKDGLFSELLEECWNVKNSTFLEKG